MAAALQHVQERHDVGVDVGVRVFKAVAYAELGCKMAHRVELFIGEQLLELITVAMLIFANRPRAFDDLIQQDFVDVESAHPEPRELEPHIIRS